MNHYDLARVTNQKDVQLWKQFLTDPAVSAYIEQEAQILTQTELRKLASDVSDSRSVGQAQLINAMSKLADKTTKKDQPLFMYHCNQIKLNVRKYRVFVIPEKIIEEPTITNSNIGGRLEMTDDELF